MLAGRFWGKTRTLCEDMKAYGLKYPGVRCAMVSPTLGTARLDLAEGESGLVTIMPPEEILQWNRSSLELKLRNGSYYRFFSAEIPDRLRGPQFHRAGCLVAGTMVETPEGMKAIETIRPGDQVRGRDGFDRVELVSKQPGSLARLDAVDGRTLIGTPDHPIWTQRGWVGIGDVRNTDTIWVWRDDGGPTGRATSTATKAARFSTSTGSSGRKRTGLSHRARRFITSTTNRLTTALRTSRWLVPAASTASCIRLSLYREPATPAAAPWPTEATPRTGASAAPSARTLPGIRGGYGRRSARTAESSSKRSLVVTAVSGASILALDGLVYNLKTERGTFFANGILTHNCDELAAWGDSQREVWDMLRFCLRLPGPDAGKRVIATTPKPQPLIKELIARSGKDVWLTKGHSFENKSNVDASAISELARDYEGTRLGRQELNAEILDDVEGALWTWNQIRYRQVYDRDTSEWQMPMARVVVGVDPMGSYANREKLSMYDDDRSKLPECGIVTCGRAVGNKHGYVIDDRSGNYTPEQWGHQVVAAYHEFSADLIAVEKNFGGDMVESTIRNIDRSVNIKLVTATRGKAVRAEPVQALYEQAIRLGPDARAQMWHDHPFPGLENQMTTWIPGEGKSPDRMDAMVWAMTELFVEEQGVARRPTGYAGRGISGGWSRDR